MNHAVQAVTPVELIQSEEAFPLAYHGLFIDEADDPSMDDEPVESDRAALAALRESDPDSYRMVVFGWA